jgi:UDP-N-acetylglucosamine acyltransferase
MAIIHPSAILEGDVDLADDVEVGPYCLLKGPIQVGARTRLLGHGVLEGPLRMGERNTIYPHVALGMAPQDLKWDPDRAGAGVVIGDGNTFREGVTIHRATNDERATTVGSETYWMANSHAGHDSVIADGCIFANGTLLGGAVRVDERVVTGGNTAIHQFCRIGRGAMLSGGVGMGKDLPPFFMLTGINTVGSLNVVGMRRWGLSHEEKADVRWVFKTLYRRGLSLQSALDALHERADRPLVAEYIAFAADSKRGICSGRSDPRRGLDGTGT